MSVTGHNPVRHPDDFYATPAWCTRAILPHLGRPDYFDRVVDPCCGDGAILDVIAEQWPDHRQSLRGVEIDARRADIAGKKHRVACADALGETQWDRAVELVVTNPPFSLAMEFVQRALEEVAPGGTVAMLLRLPWLASQKRAPWLRENTPSVYVLPTRPSFTGKGTDATDYAWMVWDGKPPTVTILDVGTT